MKCRMAQQELSPGSEVSPAVLSHLEHCEDCRRFAEDLGVFRALTGSPVPTPTDLREQTLDRCLALLTEKAATRKTSLRQRCRRLCDSPKFVAATATLSVLIVVVLTVMQLDGAQDKQTVFFVRLTIIQLFAQNLSAALFLPALLMLKNRMEGRPSYTP